MNFSDILIQHQVPYQTEGSHHCRPGWIQVDCPFCGPGTRRWHMGFNLSGKYFHCWRCGQHRAGDTLALLIGETTPECIKLLGGLTGRKTKKRCRRTKCCTPAGYVQDLLPAHRKYLQKRGFDPEEVHQRWGVGSIGPGVALAWRLFIPFYDDGELVSWSTRTIGNPKGQPRYISAGEEQESVNHKHLLYGEEDARNAVIIVEGPTDVWKIGPGAVATLGSQVTPEQIERMVKFPIRGVCFDNEPEAQKLARRLYKDLSAFPGETYLIGIDAPDPGQCSRSEIKSLRGFLNVD